MKIGYFAAASAAALALWVAPLRAQGPLHDRVEVNLPYKASIGDKTLPPGDYVFQELRSQDKSPVILVYSDNGTRFETSAMSIPLSDPNTPEDTKVVLQHYGPDYYVDKIWIQGKDYGYEFPVPEQLKSRERERAESATLKGTYRSGSDQSDQNTKATETAQATPPASPPARMPEPAEQPQPAPPPVQDTTPATPPSGTMGNTNNEANQNTTTTQDNTGNTTTQNNSAAQSSNTTTQNNSANRSMPQTSAGWLAMLLGGGALSAAGMALRKLR